LAAITKWLFLNVLGGGWIVVIKIEEKEGTAGQSHSPVIFIFHF